MKLNIVFKKEKEWFIGHIQEYPDYESQGKTLDELKENLIEIYHDINKGLVPDAEPFQLLEMAIWKEKNWLKQLSRTAVFSYAMVVIMTDIRLLNQEKANLFQGILK